MTRSVLYDRNTSRTAHAPFAGRYAYCAKCGEGKDEDRNYVHDHCTYPYKGGAFHFCAVCSKPWAEESRDYVCLDCLDW